MVRAGAALTLVPLREVSAWITCSIRLRSCCNSLIIPSMFGMDESVTSRRISGHPTRLHSGRASLTGARQIPQDSFIDRSGTKGDLYAPAALARMATWRRGQ